ncbi:MAG: 5-formyltetrahydrofolate cyclo-ligase [Thermoplasmata archaeon]|nr:MAG: 5-formyltetrahydrofolate cyclo-ligase [Thermoplasmata archaeon]
MDKQKIREKIWHEMEAKHVATFPPPYGRIPNFINASKAAENLASMEVWKKARIIKSNPDSPQKFVRKRALKEGKTIYMAVPRLKNERCFIELHGRMLANVACSIKGAFKYGKPVYPWEMKKVDLIIAGSVAVNKKGARVGKGGGYSDIEYAIAREVGIVSEDTPVITTVHDIQVINEEIPMKEHDVPIDYIITPTRIIKTERVYEKPHGIIWEILDKELPVLEILKRKIKEK